MNGSVASCPYKASQEWKDAALVLDEYMNFDEWKHIDEDPFYDWKLVRKVRKSLKTLRERRDARGLVGVLETCLRTNFAGVESARRAQFATSVRLLT